MPISERPPHHIPDWVIDTEDACIVRGCGVPRYAALSYVWSAPVNGVDGAPEGASATKERLMLMKWNLMLFRAKGFLRTDILKRVPTVIRNAIDLVRSSGVRYLWVDCLCIVQHDDTTGDRVGLMNEIYSGAYFTIIAAAGDSEGLHGSYHYTDNYVENGKPSASILHGELLCTHWASRGWTFQEQLLSKRAVIFLDDIYFWDCAREVRCPGIKQAGEATSQNSLGQDMSRSQPRKNSSHVGRVRHGPETLPAGEMTPSAPDLRLYIELVCRYNNRKLTYDQDTLPAFSGVLEAFAQNGFFGGFVCGLPALFLDSALLWQPVSKARRRSANELVARLAPRAPLPSWSWVGWQCRVDPDSLLPDHFKGLKSSGDKRGPPPLHGGETGRLVCISWRLSDR
ncbi:hypothetical protein PG991_008865 [Apiospora marii]|uniref:Heterokaryon incompatibility domain-containing protein n=1 Tax=Apiospora marii TaxID=335849 RepID=A0ABR1RM79_9PEZI